MLAMFCRCWNHKKENFSVSSLFRQWNIMSSDASTHRGCELRLYAMFPATAAGKNIVISPFKCSLKRKILMNTDKKLHLVLNITCKQISAVVLLLRYVLDTGKVLDSELCSFYTSDAQWSERLFETPEKRLHDPQAQLSVPYPDCFYDT